MGTTASKPSGLKRRSLKRHSVPNQFIPTTGPLSASQYLSRLTFFEGSVQPGTQSVHNAEKGLTIAYAALSFRGYYPYPGMQNKPNQDACCGHSSFAGDPAQLFLGVFDGHGETGTSCAKHALTQVPINLRSSAHFLTSPEEAFDDAMTQANQQLHEGSVNSALSGTTAVCALLRGKTVYIANVGDSRAVLGRRRGSNLAAHDLTKDQTPYRHDECSRVREAGAVVLAQSQLEGLKDPSIDVWENEMEDAPNDHPYIWFPTGGSAFTRSIGDLDAEQVGVIPNPEVTTVDFKGEDEVLILASDGVWEFLSSQEVVDICGKCKDPQDACYQVVATAYRLWWLAERRTDDITIIVVKMSGLDTHIRNVSDDISVSFLDLPTDKEPAASKQRVHFRVKSEEQIGPFDGMNGKVGPSKAMKKSSSKPRLVDLAQLEDRSAHKGDRSYNARSHLNLEMDLADVGHSDSENSFTRGSVVEKTAEQMDFIKQALRRLPTFLSKAPDEVLVKLIDAMEHRSLKAGDSLTRQGDIGDLFFVVETGRFDAMVVDDDDYEFDENPEPHLVRQFKPGDSIGESALRVATTSGSTVIAEVDSSVWQLHRSVYKQMIQSFSKSWPNLSSTSPAT